MQISTKVVLSQKELEEAAIAYVSSKMTVPENAEISVEFGFGISEDEATAVVDIAAGEDEKPAKTTAPKATRTRKSTPVVAQASEPETEEDAIEAEKEEAPFEVDDSQKAEGKSEDKAEIQVNEEPAAEEHQATPKATPMKIFPDATTSAAPSAKEKEEDIDPKVAAKSLFANLTKPTNH